MRKKPLWKVKLLVAWTYTDPEQATDEGLSFTSYSILPLKKSEENMVEFFPQNEASSKT
jgi:hypothetical protein